jgi:hypothetical protein
MLERRFDSIEDEEEKFNNLDTNNFKPNDNLLNDNIVMKSSSSIKSGDIIGTEEMFINLKKDIETTKKRNEAYHLIKESNRSKNNNSHQNINKSENKGEINSLKQQNNNLINEEENVNINYLQEFDIKDDNGVFEYNSLNLVENKMQDKPQPQLKLNRDWKIFNKNFPLSYEVSDKHKGYEYMELNHMAIRLIKEIDYDELGLELKLNFSLIGNSQILIFTRSFVNKEINDSDLFDNNDIDVGPNEIFNKYTSLIKIMKEMKSNRCYITFGTYHNDPLRNNKKSHKFFLKRQLIDYSEEKNDKESISINKDDVAEFNLIVNDFGEETIDTRIYMNNNKKPNDICGNFFIPLNKKAKIMIFGKGTSVRLKELSGKIFNKRNEEIKNLIKFENENNTPKSCECCNIF